MDTTERNLAGARHTLGQGAPPPDPAMPERPVVLGAAAPAGTGSRVLRIGYTLSASDPADLEREVAALRAAGCAQVFPEVAAVRQRVRPELVKALALAEAIRLADPAREVILTVPDLGQAARSTAELVRLTRTLGRSGLSLHLLGGPLAGLHTPASPMFTVLAAAADLDRGHGRAKTEQGRAEAAARGRTGGRPKVVDAAMLERALALRAQGVPVPEIAAALTITTGANAGTAPSPATLYRALAAADAARDEAALP